MWYWTWILLVFQMDQHIQFAVWLKTFPITELSETENLKALHADLIASYGQRDWNQCEQAIKQLMGKWGGEVDSFYQDLQTRIDRLKTITLPNNWTPVIPKV
jgi:hypothetical protein